jgi:hypothetical protein
MQITSALQRPALAREQMARQKKGPPWNLIDPAQNCVDIAVSLSETATFDRGEHVALEQHALHPSRRQSFGIFLWQTHQTLTLPQPRAILR